MPLRVYLSRDAHRPVCRCAVAREGVPVWAVGGRWGAMSRGSTEFGVRACEMAYGPPCA